MKERLLFVITHPASISLIIWISLFLFIPAFFSKYKVRKINEIQPFESKYYYADLDSDNQSEQLDFNVSDPEQTRIVISKKGRIIDQYNLKFHPAGGKFYYIGDYNSDGFSECYVFTMNKDSIFLSVIDQLRKQGYIAKRRFIDFRGKPGQSADVPMIKPIGMFNDSHSSIYDFYFFITSGFSIKPRNVYRYLIDADSLVKSPESGACLLDCLVFDFNNDKLPEFIFDVAAYGNTGSDVSFTDENSWLMVFNKDLDFLFTPICFKQYPSHILATPLTFNDSNGLVAFHDYYGTDTINSAFYLYDATGYQLAKSNITDFESLYAKIFPNENDGFSTFFFLRNRDGEIEEIDRNFQTIKSFKIPSVESPVPIVKLDADMDGEEEYIFQGSGDNTLFIARRDFSDCTVFKLKGGFRDPVITRILEKDNIPVLYFQYDKYGVYLQYFKNPVYYLKYPFFVTIYLFIYLFILAIFRLQRYRLQAKKEMENRMVSLQMKAIKNQIDPHFTLNVLNSIGSLYANETNREKADYIFGKYARLIRETVISSDNVIIPIADELEFVRNYIELERFRSENKFDYSIDIDKNFDLQKKIPRMLIHSFVENAVKYNLKRGTGKNFLKISHRTERKNYLIEIEDTGSTGSIDTQTESGTGKGLLIVNELIGLYYKLDKIQITYSMKDKVSPENETIGKSVLITIPV